MTTITEPNYVHYTRVKFIYANEAQELLAKSELRNKSFRDQSELDRQLKEEMILASKVLRQSFDNGDINYDDDECPESSDKEGNKIYYLSLIKISIEDFCTWAAKLKYKLPEELAVLSTLPESEVAKTDQDKKDDNETKSESKGNNTVAPATDNTKIVEGLLKMLIAMAMECYAYNPKDLKSTTTADIVNALDKCGFSVSENTIRMRLKQAQMLLPRD